jgi:hypothetical protein
MRIGRNIVLGLLGASLPNGVSQWVSGSAYPRNSTVAFEGFLYSNTIRIKQDSIASLKEPDTVWFWKNNGPAFSAWSNGTNADASFYPAWSTISDYTVGDIVYDGYSLSDYICMVDQDDEDERPSTNPIDPVTKRPAWSRLGPANAFKMVDGQTISRTVYTGPLALTANVRLSSPATLIGIFGIKGCNQITARAYKEDATTTSGSLRTFDMSYSGDTGHKSKLVFPTTAEEIANGKVWKFTFSKASGANSVEVGMISACVAVEFGVCQVQPRVSGLSFSNTKYDDTFGDVNFVKRGFANEISCEIFTEQDRQDFLVSVLNRFQGEPVIIDLNNGTSYEHLTTWGFYDTYSADYYGWSNSDTKITLSIKGLVDSS